MDDERKTSTKQRVLIHEKAMQQIARIVLERQLSPGDRLPTERELASRLQISRPSIRDALQVFAANGLVETRQGSGSYIKGGQDAWQDVVSDHLAEGGILDEMIWLMEARLLMEPYGFCEAAKHISDIQLNQFYREEAENFTQLLESSDTEMPYGFHGNRLERAIMAFQPNRILTELHLTVIDRWEQCKRDYDLVAMPTVRRHQEHLAILNALGARDPAEIEKRVTAHLNGTYHNLLFIKEQGQQK